MSAKKGDPGRDVPSGVAEEATQFASASEERWAIARARLEEHERTGAGSMSVEEFGQKLRAEIARLRAATA